MKEVVKLEKKRQELDEELLREQEQGQLLKVIKKIYGWIRIQFLKFGRIRINVFQSLTLSSMSDFSDP